MGFGPITGKRMAHMYGRELAIWDLFLSSQGDKVRECQYDVHLGIVKCADPLMSPQDRELWEMLTCKRVDVVFRWDGILYLVEVKDIQNMSGLGQVLCYVHIWNEEKRPEGPARPLVVCGRLDPDLKGVYVNSHVEVVCV